MGLKDYWKLFKKLVSEGEVDNDVELTGDLAKEPGQHLKSVISSEDYVKKLRTRAAKSKAQAKNTEVSDKTVTVTDKDDELDR